MSRFRTILVKKLSKNNVKITITKDIQLNSILNPFGLFIQWKIQKELLPIINEGTSKVFNTGMSKKLENKKQLILIMKAIAVESSSTNVNTTKLTRNQSYLFF